jgi:chromosome partitioning protein
MIITIASFKGGVGKTTTAIHLAEWLSLQRRVKSVVLADSDPNATAY